MMAHVRRTAVALAACVLICMFPGSNAYAWFNDVTDEYPATQDIPISGSVLTGADVPEGVYSITATTSSYMCKLSSVTLTSAGGELWATFTMSGAYNALYFGTADEAAAATNEDGTDVSAYYISDPLEGYVSRQFSLPIPALNEEMMLATYSGGSKGIDKGMWYTRTVVFNSSSEVDDAIAGGGDGQDEGGDDPPSDDPGGSDDDSGYVPDESGDEDSQPDETPDDETPDSDADDESADGPSDDGSGSKSKSSSSAASKTPSNTPSNGTQGDQNSTDNTAGEEEGNAGDEEKSSDESASSEAAAPKEEKAAGGARMKEITFAGNQVVELGEGVDPELLQQKENEQNKAQQAGVVAAGALGALNVALAGAYIMGLRRTKPQLFVKAAKKISRFRGKN